MLIIQSNSEASEYLEWKPGENTIAYYLLESENYTDESGNGHTLTAPNGTPNYDTTEFSNGVYAGNKPLRYGNLGSFSSSQSFTVSFMIKSTADTGLFRFTNYGNGDRNNFDCSLASGQISASIYTGSSAVWSAWGDNLSDGNWHNIVIVKDGSTYTGYQDGVQKSTWSNSTTIICYNSSQLGCHPNSSSVPTTIRMARFIVENVGWSSEDVVSYFKKIKNKFGIS